MADIHEHLVDPLTATLEAARVARRWLVMTIFEEWRLPSGGQHLEAGLARCTLDTQAAGYPSYEAYMAQVYPQAAIVGDDVKPHHYHINQFADADIIRLHDAIHLDPTSKWRTITFLKVPEAEQDGHIWSNWLLALERVD